MTCCAQMPLVMPNFIVLGQTMYAYEKCVTKPFRRRTRTRSAARIEPQTSGTQRASRSTAHGVRVV